MVGFLFPQLIATPNHERITATMATLNACLDAIQTHIGFPRSRSSGVARRLQESKLLPAGAPGVAPELDQRDACLLLAVLMSAPMLHAAVDHARAYAEM